MTTSIAGTAAGGMAGNTQAARRALRGFDTGLAIFFGGVAAVAATDAMVLWFFRKLRSAVDRYGWGNVPQEEIPPFGFFDQWGTQIDLGAHRTLRRGLPAGDAERAPCGRGGRHPRLGQ